MKCTNGFLSCWKDLPPQSISLCRVEEYLQQLLCIRIRTLKQWVFNARSSIKCSSQNDRSIWNKTVIILSIELRLTGSIEVGNCSPSWHLHKPFWYKNWYKPVRSIEDFTFIIAVPRKYRPINNVMVYKVHLKECASVMCPVKVFKIWRPDFIGHSHIGPLPELCSVVSLILGVWLRFLSCKTCRGPLHFIPSNLSPALYLDTV